ncbi:MAG TPA: AbrB/MazE/SpoVT family DNA-binding domain-containing protein [Anaerolineaceae bacterium]|jgi:AbrB family looped-hinge helix DNA binding protein|nr:AbrB/MazE/SpoVT family DNA-binding domain-containing protein [Longilinea sp.]HNZ12189.1 AbrB/MazE/SpoVT family DNA-binding domain-containing protein [Anaerolineaceae bacterium]HOD05628.1 AbrB/MazE/SpoVT family DNA-binding domain-containing protein [Anaerolineaceae bacterium]HQF64101.1 AbrB/MazE/SpoVT family DNA-binding domain-containing protein [Anaerolineaceae bacterium]HQH87109.1 AbrB/MazE/SpoVT family DNA-binding domain-containing protein [Anaerolineaceae bacterium]
MPVPPEGKRFYGAITVSERGQIVIPADARRDFNIQVGDKLLVLGDLEQGLALIKASALLERSPDFFQFLLGSRPPEAPAQFPQPPEEAE